MQLTWDLFKAIARFTSRGNKRMSSVKFVGENAAGKAIATDGAMAAIVSIDPIQCDCNEIGEIVEVQPRDLGCIDPVKVISALFLDLDPSIDFEEVLCGEADVCPEDFPDMDAAFRAATREVESSFVLDVGKLAAIVELLKVAGCDRVSVSISSSTKAIVFQSKDDKVKALLMPMDRMR